MDLHLKGHDRVKLGKMLNPVRGFIDAGGALFALVGTVALYLAAGKFEHRLSFLVYGFAMVGLYTVSCLYHSIPWQETWKYRMQKLDHSMIYVLVAGSYTPIAIFILHGTMQWATLVVIWGITAVGVSQKFLFPQVGSWFAVVMTTSQGWLGVFLLIPLAETLGPTAVALTLVGGVLYTVGMVFLVTGWPKLWPRVFSHHEAMHVLIVGGSFCHFLMTFRYIAPLAA